MNSCRKAYKFEFHGFDGSTSTHCDWKMWTTEAGGKLRWELRRVLPSLGYTLSARVQVKDHIRDQQHLWDGLFHAVQDGAPLLVEELAQYSFRQSAATT